MPHLVPQAAGISHSSFRRHKDYVIVSDTLEGLSTAAESRSGAAKKQVEEVAAGGTAAGPPVIGEKRRPEQKAAGGVETKRRRLVTKRSAPTQKKPAVVVGKCRLSSLNCCVTSFDSYLTFLQSLKMKIFLSLMLRSRPRVPRMRVQLKCHRHPLPRWCRSRRCGQRVPQRMLRPRFLTLLTRPTI